MRKGSPVDPYAFRKVLIELYTFLKCLPDFSNVLANYCHRYGKTLPPQWQKREMLDCDYTWKHFTHIGYYFLIHYTSF